MAKKKSEAVKTQQEKLAKKGNPSLKNGSVPWVAPFPEATVDENGIDKVMVRAVPTQDIRINGHLLHAGREVVLPCSIAHAHASALSAPPGE